MAFRNWRTNLLPLPRIRAMRRAYFVRLATIALLGGAVLVTVHGFLSAPAYLYLSREATSQRQELESLNAQLSRQRIGETNARLKALNENTAFLAGLKDVPMASAAIRAVLGIPHEGIAISSVSYTAPQPPKPGTMVLSGTATTRNALQQYQHALEAAPFITGVNLPVEAYAKETDIAFTVTLTGTATP
ncbi:MAG TPA: hypothetical protein VF829_00165 [Candidatus Paceibacterota bacterium]